MRHYIPWRHRDGDSCIVLEQELTSKSKGRLRMEVNEHGYTVARLYIMVWVMKYAQSLHMMFEIIRVWQLFRQKRSEQ